MNKEIKIVVTGGAGFIGSHIVEELNEQGYTNIVIIDDFSDGRKLLNLKTLKYRRFVSVTDFRDAYQDGGLDEELRGAKIIFNEGAMSSTTENNGNKLIDQNIYPALSLINWISKNGGVLSHASSASVYGNNQKSSPEIKFENPINPYAMSKKIFDDIIRKSLKSNPVLAVQSWRYFNVYGEREDHKDGMRSMITKFIIDRPAKLFNNSNKVKRDFIYVKDVAKVQVDAALKLYEAKTTGQEETVGELNGIFNLGTGQATNVQEIADAIKERQQKCFKEIPFPKELEGRYQYFTEADMSATPLPEDFKFKTVFEFLDEKFIKIC